jgi:hypothetical protein
VKILPGFAISGDALAPQKYYELEPLQLKAQSYSDLASENLLVVCRGYSWILPSVS